MTASLNRPPAHVQGIAEQTIARTYYLDANVLKASEDKTYPGAIVASLASPWGQAVNAGTYVGGKAVYFGSYREVFARDLYEAFTGLLADGDLSTARAADLFLFDKQQLPTGEIPRNSLVNGKAAPDTGGDQLDETSYPILMAYEAGLGGDTALWTEHIKPAADFLVSHGPSFGVERWEEQSGYSPSTIAAEIAGLTAASAIARMHGDSADAALYQATADDFQRNVKSWTVTSTGSQSTAPYFIRLSKTGDPNAATSYSLSNGAPDRGPARRDRRRLPGAGAARRALAERPDLPELAFGAGQVDLRQHALGHRLLPVRRRRIARQRRRLRRLLDDRQPDLVHRERRAVAHHRRRHRAPVAGAVRGTRGDPRSPRTTRRPRVPCWTS
jgi:hypothetical protein